MGCPVKKEQAVTVPAPLTWSCGPSSDVVFARNQVDASFIDYVLVCS
jgi:hypothetical protein